MAEKTEGAAFMMRMVRVGVVFMMHEGMKTFVGGQGPEQQDPQGEERPERP